MKYTQKNGLNISAMTLGTVQLGMAYGVNNKSGVPSQEASFGILDAAHAGGVTILDTSNDYGKSEEVIGQYMRENPDKKFAICTKFRTDGCENDISGALETFAHKSAEKLGVDKIDIFMSHIETDYLNHGEALAKALRELKQEGIITSSAISLSKKEHFEEIVNSGVFDAIQIPMNILDNEEIRNGMIKRAADSGIAIFVRSVYLQGLLFKTPEEVKNTKFRDAAPLLEKINNLARGEGITIPELALTFIRDTEGVSSLVVGSETREQVLKNVDTFNIPTLSKKTYNKILEEFADVDKFLISPWEWAKRQ